LGGFLEASFRHYADGCHTHPVGYIEGWYVDPDLQRHGIGGRLVQVQENLIGLLMNLLENQIAIVTSGGNCIGREIALALVNPTSPEKVLTVGKVLGLRRKVASSTSVAVLAMC
jgi:GNAT superfamily N-acetyltransferase